MEIRRKFDEDFKEGVLRIVRQTGKPIAHAVTELGLHKGTLGWWVNLGRSARDGEGPLTHSGHAERNRLRKENAELAMEPGVLKRSAALRVKEAVRQ